MSNKPNKIKKLGRIILPSPSPIKSEYEDLPWDEFVSLDDVLEPELAGCYMGNKNCELLTTSTGKITKPGEYYFDGTYPSKNLSHGEYMFNKKIHIIFGDKFLINDDPINKTIVDHCDGNPLNLSLLNLRHVTPQENVQNSRPKNRDRYVFRVYAETDINHENVLEEHKFSEFTHRQLSYIGELMKKKGVYKNQIWIKVDLVTEEYTKTYGPPHEGEWNPVTCRGWKQSRLYSHVMVNSNGYLKVNGVITVGNLQIFYNEEKATKGRYYVIEFGDGITWRVHRFLWTEFHNTELPKGVDHIDHWDSKYNPVNNSIFNLLRTDIKGNMNNPRTKLKKSKAISKIDPDTGQFITYDSITLATMDMGLSYKCLTAYLKGNRYLCCGWLWSYSGDESNRWKEYKKHEKYLLETTGRMPVGYWVIKERCERVAKLCKNRTQFIRNYPGAFLSSKKMGWDEEWFPSNPKLKRKKSS